MVHLNSIRIVMAKEDDKKIFYLFPKKGVARDMTHGFGELVKFSETYRELLAEGYKQVYN